MSAAEPNRDGRPHLIGRVGSLDAFWPLIEGVLADLRPRRFCEIGVDKGIFTDRLLAWGANNGCGYVGIDPAPDPAAAERIFASGASSGNRLIIERSLDALRELEPSDVYFIDGDHNYHTVRGELDLIASVGGPVIFAHDVSWPWARRDMYHCASDIPEEARHPFSEDLGVSLDGDALVEGGFRSQDRYSIARHVGGSSNGVLTGIEDFLASEVGNSWRFILLPMAYGLGILYRPYSIPDGCRRRLEGLDVAIGTLGRFLESSEANFLRLYLYAEEITAQADALRPLVETYRALEASYRTLDDAYVTLSKHSETLLADYNKLLELYHELDYAFKSVGAERDEFRERLGDGG